MTKFAWVRSIPCAPSLKPSISVLETSLPLFRRRRSPRSVPVTRLPRAMQLPPSWRSPPFTLWHLDSWARFSACRCCSTPQHCTSRRCSGAGIMNCKRIRLSERRVTLSAAFFEFLNLTVTYDVSSCDARHAVTWWFWADALADG